MMKPCLDCGTPANGSRCSQHAAQRKATLQQSQNTRRANTGGRSKYGGAHQRGGRAVRANATRCWLCNAGPTPNDPFQADHLIQGNRTTGGGPLAPAHRSCNIRRRHLTQRGWTHQRIVERLQLLRNGPQGQPERAASSHPGRILPEGTPDDPAPFDRADVSGVGASDGGGL